MPLDLGKAYNLGKPLGLSKLRKLTDDYSHVLQNRQLYMFFTIVRISDCPNPLSISDPRQKSPIKLVVFRGACAEMTLFL